MHVEDRRITRCIYDGGESIKMKYYKILEGMPVRTNCPQLDWQKITEEEYIKIRDEKNAEIAEQDRIREEQMKPIQEEHKLINERMKKMARDQLIEEGIING